MIRTFIIGIDPGTDTGLCIKDFDTGKIITILTLKIHDALELVKLYTKKYRVFVRVEDARRVRYYTDPVKKQGAGSVKRDCAIWEHALQNMNVRYQFAKPSQQKKWDQGDLEYYTGYTKRTSYHGRDACRLIVNINQRHLQTFMYGRRKDKEISDCLV